MKRKLNFIGVVFFSILVFMSDSCQSTGKSGNSQNSQKDSTGYKVTFIELGSVRCIPCQMMQPVMKSIERNYGKQVKVVFYDVWTEGGAPFATKYGVQAIPTQVFLDLKGKEFFRHEGFFPENELVKMLKTKGIL